jgi:hypothetical protein
MFNATLWILEWCNRLILNGDIWKCKMLTREKPGKSISYVRAVPRHEHIQIPMS